MQNTKSFPRELLQAGRVDGLGELQLFTKVYMPTMKPTYAAAAIITFMSNWNNFLWPLIALQSQDKKTLPLIVSSLASSYNPDYGMIMVSIVITLHCRQLSSSSCCRSNLCKGCLDLWSNKYGNRRFANGPKKDRSIRCYLMNLSFLVSWFTIALWIC